jgi:hypothetical protein
LIDTYKKIVSYNYSITTLNCNPKRGENDVYIDKNFEDFVAFAFLRDSLWRCADVLIQLRSWYCNSALKILGVFRFDWIFSSARWFSLLSCHHFFCDEIIFPTGTLWYHTIVDFRSHQYGLYHVCRSWFSTLARQQVEKRQNERAVKEATIAWIFIFWSSKGIYTVYRHIYIGYHLYSIYHSPIDHLLTWYE